VNKFKNFRTFKIDIALNVLELSRCTSSVALTPLAYQFSFITVLELEKPDKLSKICSFILHKYENGNVSCNHLLCEFSSHYLHSEFANEEKNLPSQLIQDASLGFLGLHTCFK
jgi:hypothetical protein